MKKNGILKVTLFSLFVSAILASSANALVFTFSDKDFLGGASWGTMTITAFDSDTLQVRYDAAGYIPAGSQATGFGFNFNPDAVKPNSISNPADGDFAFDNNNLNWIELNNLNSIPNPSNGDEFSPVITKNDFIWGATEGNANNISPPGILAGTTDIFFLNFLGIGDLTVIADLGQFVDLAGIRLQGLPLNINGGSLMLAGVGDTPQNPVPEPATMLLLGTGLIGLAGIGRKKILK